MRPNVRARLIGVIAFAGLASMAQLPARAGTDAAAANTPGTTVPSSPVARQSTSALSPRQSPPTLRAPVGAGATQVLKASNGGEIALNKKGTGCEGAALDVKSGRVNDSTPGLVSTLDFTVDLDCSIHITDAKTGVPMSEQPRIQRSPGAITTDPQQSTGGTPPTAGSTSFEPNTTFGNFIRSSQTLQDPFNVDIAKWKWTHDRVWDDVWNDTRFKNPGEDGDGWVYWGEASTSVSWNHQIGAYFDLADTDWRTDNAWSIGHADFHSDFLWCNLQPGRNFWLQTVLFSYPGGGYDVNFLQSNVCSATHVATSKWTSTSFPPY